MINYDLINKELLQAEIEKLEQWYVETAINLIKWPVFIDNCSKAIEVSEWERKTELEKVLDQHKKNQKTNEEAIETLNTILPEVKLLLTK